MTGPTGKRKIVFIGAGLSGIYFGMQMPKVLPDVEFVIYEKNSTLGGTWWENRYPGCACDTPSHTYTFKDEPYAEWDSCYSGSEQIYEYLSMVTKKYNADKNMVFSTKVVEGRWNEEKGKWAVTTQNIETGDEQTEECDWLISGTGALNQWRWPDIPGLHTFKGPLMHTARWDPSIDLKGKTVIQIGSGASGIQLTPKIQPIVKQLYLFSRSQSWCLPYRFKGNYTEEEKRHWRENPEELRKYRAMLEEEEELRFRWFRNDTMEQAQMVAVAENHLASQVKDPVLREKLRPNYRVGCRRITPSDDFYPAVAQPNVEYIIENTKEVTPEGVISESGKLYKADVIICATGFDTRFIPPYGLIGQNGLDIAKLWEKIPEAYHGHSVHGFPNYFMIGGPNTPYGQGTIIGVSQAGIDFVLQVIKAEIERGIKYIMPKKAVQDEFNKFIQSYLKDTVWTDPCTCWYKAKDGSGRILAIWPGPQSAYRKAVSKPKWDDYEITMWA